MSRLGRDQEILRRLAAGIGEIASDPVNDERRGLWRRLNGLHPVRPPIFINEIPWHELIETSEHECADGFARGVELFMRTMIYQWEHMPGDMVVDAVWHSPLAVTDTGFGVEPKWLDPHGTGSRQYLNIIKTEADVERFRVPEVIHDEEESERRFQFLSEAFGDILPVEKRGIVHRWFSPWDFLIAYWGVEELYLDMYDRPDLVNAGVSRIVDGYLAVLRQWQEQGLLSTSNGNHRVGSNGLGITDELPGPENAPQPVTPMHQWGTATGQIFSDVSPEQHWEFCLRHEMRWLEKFGLNNYGCCEPLHTKSAILKSIPRLRKVSAGPKSDKSRMAEEFGSDYVIAVKPNPAVFAPDEFSPEAARAALREEIEPLRGLCVEIVMKDITTVRCDPPRLWKWAEIAREVAEEFAQ